MATPSGGARRELSRGLFKVRKFSSLQAAGGSFEFPISSFEIRVSGADMGGGGAAAGSQEVPSARVQQVDFSGGDVAMRIPAWRPGRGQKMSRGRWGAPARRGESGCQGAPCFAKATQGKLSLGTAPSTVALCKG